MYFNQVYNLFYFTLFIFILFYFSGPTKTLGLAPSGSQKGKRTWLTIETETLALCPCSSQSIRSYLIIFFSLNRAIVC